MTDRHSATATAPATPPRKALTAKQESILAAIQASIAQSGYPPSMREIGDAVGLKSLSSVTHQLNQLELAGRIRRDPNRPRALEVLGDATTAAAPVTSILSTSDDGDTAHVPMVGRIAAGIPITAEQQVEDCTRCSWGARARRGPERARRCSGRERRRCPAPRPRALAPTHPTTTRGRARRGRTPWRGRPRAARRAG